MCQAERMPRDSDPRAIKLVHRWAACLGAASALAAASVGPATANAAAPYAPIDQPGPALTVPQAQLAASLRCTGTLAHAPVEPVLLVASTAVDSDQNFAWSYEPVLRNRGIPYCTSDLPGADAENMDDIENRADYLVYAIRTMYRASGERIALIGGSQGGEAERLPLRFWPDTRAMVADVIALDSPNHGSITVNALCAITCAPALWQQTYGSHFIQALNSGQETFAGISYTDIATYTDDFVEPDLPGDSSVFLDGPGDITNVAIQDICPLAVADHLLLASTNPIAVALALDAIAYPGPADPSRIDRSVCGAGPFASGVPLGESISGFAAAAAQVAGQLALAPRVSAEPALTCYVTASCPATSPLALTSDHTHAIAHRPITLRFTVTVTVDGVVSPVPGATIWFGDGRHLTTDPQGQATTTLAFGTPGRRRIIATASEYLSAHTTIAVLAPSRSRRRAGSRRSA
jgi:triacylglycerol esterase/lipase EstA (alpha/beta hydrolase family)